ncbi:MAG: DUF1080 domain-containing protein [Planctomycetota bacterium]
MRLLVLIALLTVAGTLQEPSRKTRSFEVSAFESLFDGKSLKGWTTTGGRYDGKARWTVEDGVLTGREGPRRAGGLIYTEKKYRSFLLSLETRIDHPFDSGIFLHMTPEAKGLQVTLDYRPGGEIGGIYSEGWLLHNREAKRAFKRDAWNHFLVRCTGVNPRVEVWMNGERITDYQRPEGARGFAKTGLIGLQVHGDRQDPAGNAARFRRIRVLELPTVYRELFSVDDRGQLHASAKAKQLGWKNLLSGGLDAWERVGGKAGETSGYVLEDGVLSFPKAGPGGHLRTREDFGDFELRMDFKMAFMCNSGLFLRGARGGKSPSYSGCEIQILDDFNWERVTGHELRDWQQSGSLYGAVAPGVEGALRPLGSWNTFQVRYAGTRLRVELNEELLYDVDTLEVGGKPPFAERARKGFIGLQRHAPPEVRDGPYAWFRNIWVRPVE